MTIKLQSSKMKNGKQQTPLYNTLNIAYGAVDCFHLQQIFLFSFEVTPRVANVIANIGAPLKLFHCRFFFFYLFPKFPILSLTDEDFFKNEIYQAKKSVLIVNFLHIHFYLAKMGIGIDTIRSRVDTSIIFVSKRNTKIFL